MNQEYMCLRCLAIIKGSELKDGSKCPKCDNDHLLKTYNASDSTDASFH
jgi:DNA-directed RNA polymerase subunit RPC12/RpoP